MSIRVSEFRHIPGKNDAEYIKLLKEALERQKQITNKAIAKIKELSNSSESPNGWIPCTPETMPKEGILVWVSMGNEVALWRRYNSDWYQDGLTSWVIPVEETEAWMPIEVPEPYQSKEDES